MTSLQWNCLNYPIENHQHDKILWYVPSKVLNTLPKRCWLFVKFIRTFTWPGRLRIFYFYILFNVNVKNSEPPGFIMLHFLSQLDPLFENTAQITIYSHPGWTSPSMVSLHKTSPPREQSHSSMRHWLMWTSDTQWLLVMSIG